MRSSTREDGDMEFGWHMSEQEARLLVAAYPPVNIADDFADLSDDDDDDEQLPTGCNLCRIGPPRAYNRIALENRSQVEELGIELSSLITGGINVHLCDNCVERCSPPPPTVRFQRRQRALEL